MLIADVEFPVPGETTRSSVSMNEYGLRGNIGQIPTKKVSLKNYKLKVLLC